MTKWLESLASLVSNSNRQLSSTITNQNLPSVDRNDGWWVFQWVPKYQKGSEKGFHLYSWLKMTPPPLHSPQQKSKKEGYEWYEPRLPSAILILLTWLWEFLWNSDTHNTISKWNITKLQTLFSLPWSFYLLYDILKIVLYFKL